MLSAGVHAASRGGVGPTFSHRSQDDKREPGQRLVPNLMADQCWSTRPSRLHKATLPPTIGALHQSHPCARLLGQEILGHIPARPRRPGLSAGHAECCFFPAGMDVKGPSSMGAETGPRSWENYEEMNYPPESWARVETSPVRERPPDESLEDRTCRAPLICKMPGRSSACPRSAGEAVPSREEHGSLLAHVLEHTLKGTVGSASQGAPDSGAGDSSLAARTEGAGARHLLAEHRGWCPRPACEEPTVCTQTASGQFL